MNTTWDASLEPISRHLKYILQDVWNIETIVHKLSWQRDMWKNNILPENMWMRFAQIDMDLFHIELRSIFDYLSKTLTILSNNPDQVRGRGKSFNQLYNWLNSNPNNILIFGKELANLVLSCNWFYDIKDLRDLKTHYGGYSLVFIHENRILLQVYKGWSKQIQIPEIMFNENVVDFELYAGLYIGYLYAYLEKASNVIDSKLTLKKVGTDARSYHPGLEIIHEWISKLL